jgi:predicted membrane-bound spermidine synthase
LISKLRSEQVTLLLICIAQFGWLTLLSPTLSTAAGGQDATYILTAHFIFVGLGFWLSNLKLPKIVGETSFAARLFPLFLLLSVSMVKFELESVKFDQILYSGYQGLGLRWVGLDWFSFTRLLFAVGISSLSYAYYIGLVFKAQTERSVRLYGIELTGALIGIGTAVFFLELGYWSAVASACFITAFLAAFLTLGKSMNTRALIIATAIVGTGIYLGFRLEPHVNINMSARDFSYGKSVIELEKRWNLYSKVQKLEIDDGQGPYRVISIGDGLGHSALNSFQSAPIPTSITVAAAMKPRTVLLLFAGSGSEVFAYRRAHPEVEKITGVELNPRVVELAFGDTVFGLNKMLHQHGDTIVVADVRAFLENGQARYDQIIFSWSGTTAVQHAGVILQTTSYAYTDEALRAAQRRLNPGGSLVFFGGPTFQKLSFFKRIGGENWTESFAVLARDIPGEKPRGWDSRLILYKNSEFQMDELARIRKASDESSEPYFIEHAPRAAMVNLRVSFVEQYIQALDQGPAFVQINDQKIRADTRTDDDPFVYDNRFSNGRPASSFQSPKELALIIILLLVLFGIVRAASRNVNSARSLAGGPVLLAVIAGGSFAATKAFALYKSSLFLDSPTLALSVAFSASLVGQGLCCMRFDSGWERQWRFIGIIAVIAWMAFAFIAVVQSEMVFSLPIWIRGAWIFVHLCFATYCSSFLFLMILRTVEHVDSKLEISRVFAADALASGLVMILTPVMVRTFGISWVFGLALLGLLALSLIQAKKNPRRVEGFRS